MLINMVLPGVAGSAEELVAFEYSGNFTDNRDANGKGTVRFNTSGTLTVLSGEAIVLAYILAGGGGGVQNPSGSGKYSASGGGGGYQTVGVELASGTYDIVIGLGGSGFYGATSGEKEASDGGNTTAFGVTVTGGIGGDGSSSPKAGAGGTPNGDSGSEGNSVGGSPNGGASNGGSASANNGGDGYVELTFS